MKNSSLCLHNMTGILNDLQNQIVTSIIKDSDIYITMNIINDNEQ